MPSGWSASWSGSVHDLAPDHAADEGDGAAAARRVHRLPAGLDAQESAPRRRPLRLRSAVAAVGADGSGGVAVVDGTTAVTRSLLAFAGCLAVGIAVYPLVIGELARRGAGQRIAAYGPRHHLVKAGTPTMGGIVFCVLAILAWVLLDRSRAGFVVAFAILGGAVIGMVDDVANVRGLGELGLRPRQKLVLQTLVGVLVGIGLHAAGLSREVVPGLGAVDFGVGIVPLATVAVVATSNAVNLTDGVDGLAGTCSVLVLSGLWALALHAHQRAPAVLAAALIGGVLAFLVYNWTPARVFMGDTGALALGCGLAALASELRLLWLLPLFGLVFLVETLSVIVNVTAITRFRRRIFRSSPLHHHFEELGVGEERLVLGFAAAAAAATVSGALVALPMGVGG